MIFGFSLCVASLLVIQIAYFRLGFGDLESGILLEGDKVYYY